MAEHAQEENKLIDSDLSGSKKYYFKLDHRNKKEEGRKGYQKFRYTHSREPNDKSLKKEKKSRVHFKGII